jgi:hypothetical protein
MTAVQALRELAAWARRRATEIDVAPDRGPFWNGRADGYERCAVEAQQRAAAIEKAEAE